MTDADDFESRYAELQDQYVERTRERIAEIEAVLAEADGAPDEEAMETIYQIVHRLAGSGETMGFGAISERSIALEDELEAVRDGETTGDGLVEQVETYCAAIRRQLNG